MKISKEAVSAFLIVRGDKVRDEILRELERPKGQAFSGRKSIFNLYKRLLRKLFKLRIAIWNLYKNEGCCWSKDQETASLFFIVAAEGGKILIDARTAIFERAELFWEPALLTRERVDRSTIPIGWHCYELEARYTCANISIKSGCAQ